MFSTNAFRSASPSSPIHELCRFGNRVKRKFKKEKKRDSDGFSLLTLI